MDGQRFDALARALTGTGSRRRVLATLSGVALGALAPLFGLPEVEAGGKKKKKKKKKKNRDKNFNPNPCQGAGKDPLGSPCGRKACCSPSLGQVCCKSKKNKRGTCCKSGQGCSKKHGLCTVGTCGTGGYSNNPCPRIDDSAACCPTSKPFCCAGSGEAYAAGGVCINLEAGEVCP